MPFTQLSSIEREKMEIRAQRKLRIDRFRCEKCERSLTNALPFGDPTVTRIHHGDHTVKVGACAIKNLVSVISQMQKVFTIVAALLVELVKRLEKERDRRLKKIEKSFFENSFKRME